MRRKDAIRAFANELSGRRLGEWVLGALIGSGGFADVFAARQPRLERDAVIKVLRHRDGDDARVEMFKREALVASQLDHPYAAHVYSFGVESDGLMWIAMELVRGKSLDELVRESGPLPIARFVPLFERLCEVVHSAHESGLIHRDIKPANVMVVTRAGRLLPKLLDFGIAEFSGETSAGVGDRGMLALTRDGLDADSNDWESPDTIVDPAIDPNGATVESNVAERQPVQTRAAAAMRSGTPAYMAPEQWLAESTADHRADIYSLGVLAQVCLTGNLPFRRMSVAHFLQSDAPPERLGDEFPEELATLLLRALARDPNERFASALEFGLAVRAVTTMPAPPRLSRNEAIPWLLSAPKHLGDALASFELETGSAANEALASLLSNLSQWVAVLAMAASASRGPRVVVAAAALRDRRQSTRDWLELAVEICLPYREQPEDFPIPELASWLTQDDTNRERLLSLAAMSTTEKAPGEAAFGLLRSLLSSLRFICDYSLDDRELVLHDGEGAELFGLAPLVLTESPTRASEPELFLIAGSKGQMLMTSQRGFEVESHAVNPWLEHFFCLTSQAPLLAEETSSGPYRGLATFSGADASLFFGRNREVQQLFNRLMAQSFVALAGPSGSGKSSLVAAGLIPRMPNQWLMTSFRPGNTPLLALAAALRELPCAFGDLRSDIGRLPVWLEDEGRKLLITIDQAEELMTLATPADSHALAASLVRLLRSPRVRLLLTIRDDFVAAAAASIEPWREMLSAGVVLVGKPTREELYNMVVGPAERVGYQFDDPTLPLEMVNEVTAEAVALPLISFAASQLWAQRDPERRLLLRAAYQRMGGVAGALAGYAEAVLAGLTTARQSQVRSLFRRLVTREGTRAVIRASELATTRAEHQVIEHLVAARLLVAAEGADGTETITLVHEALLTRWPRLAQWRIEDDEAVRFRADLRAASITWHERNRDPSYLWSGAALRNLDEFVLNSGENLSPAESAFANASRLAQSRRGRLRRLGVLGAVGVLAAALVIVLVLNRSVESNRARAEARLTQMLTSRGLAELTAHRSVRALPYLHAAYERGDESTAVRLGLDLALKAMPRERASVVAHDGAIRFLTGATDDAFLTHSDGEKPRLWRWSGSAFESLASFEHIETQRAGIAADGERIVTASLHAVKFWKPSGERVAEIEQKAYCFAIAFPPNGKHIATGDGDSIALWDLEGNRAATLGELSFKSVILALAFSRDSKLVAAARSDNKVVIWNYAERALLHEVELDAEAVSMIFLGDRGEMLLVAQANGGVTKIELQLDPPDDPESGSKDDQTVVRRDAAVMQRQVGDGLPLVLQCQTDDRCLAFSNSANRLSIIETKSLAPIATISATSNRIQAQQSTDGAFIVAEERDGQRVRVFDGATYREIGSQDYGRRGTGAFISSDNQTLIIGTTEGSLTALDITTRDARTVFRAHDSKRPGRDGTPNQVWNARFMPEGDLIASFDNFAVFLWEADTGKVVKKIALDGGTPVGAFLSVSRDGRRLLLPEQRQADIFDIESGLRIAKFSDDLLASAMSWTDDHVITATQESRSNDNFMTAWNRHSEELVAEREMTSRVSALEAGGPGVVYYSQSGEIGRWDFLGETSWKHTLQTTNVLALSGDGRFVSTGVLDGNIYVWNARTGELYRRFRAPADSTVAIALGPEGRLLATGADDLGLYLWDVEKGVSIGRFTGHNSPLQSIAISSNGSRIVSVDKASNVLVWELNREERSPAEIGAIVADVVPYELEGVELVPRSEP